MLSANRRAGARERRASDEGEVEPKSTSNTSAWGEELLATLAAQGRQPETISSTAPQTTK
eukprot:SAG11_NODE_18055_length_501_cov_0.895522_1_plen_59_part_10